MLTEVVKKRLKKELAKFSQTCHDMSNFLILGKAVWFIAGA